VRRGARALPAQGKESLGVVEIQQQKLEFSFKLTQVKNAQMSAAARRITRGQPVDFSELI
jgi:hypothetical protein